jgi:glutathione S-transferase
MTGTVLVIGNKNYSSWSFRPWLLLRQSGIPFREQRLALDTPAYAAEIGRWSPTRRVPVLHDGDTVVWDSLAICEYVSERWLAGAGWPTDALARAEARSLSAEMHSGFGALRAALPMNVRVHYPGYPLTEAVRRDVARIESAWAACRTRHGAGGPFLCGRFSIVDAMYAPVVLRFVSYDVAVSAATRAYMDAVLALPAVQEWCAAGRAETERIAADEVEPPPTRG